MGNIYQREGENTVYVTKVPDYYAVGKGIRYRGNTKDIKISREFIKEFTSTLNEKDLVKLQDFLKIVASNYYRGQTLTTSSIIDGRRYAKPMVAENMAKIIGKSTRTVYRLLKWLMEQDIVRRGKKRGAIVVNPDKLMLGNRLHASEYYLFKDILQSKVSKKYDRLLTMEYLDCLEDYTEEEIKELERLKREGEKDGMETI